MNVADSEVVKGILAEAGYQGTDSPDSADVILINTCAIREHAEERVLGRLTDLYRFKSKKPDLVIGVLGCMSKHLGPVITEKAPYVDFVVSPDGYRRLPDLIGRDGDEPFLDLRLDKREIYSEVDPVREEGINGWITIMRGCDKFCTFCVVPYVRGRERSIPPEEILRQARNLSEEGFKEVTLLGQTVNGYHYNGTDFADLLNLVSEIEGIERIRFTSPHPSDFSEKDIDIIAKNRKVCNHIHLPVQSGSDRILERMKRTYTRLEYLNLVRKFRERIPRVSLTTDFIVGFCGERIEDFENTLDLVQEVRFDSAFMFKYSQRSLTTAYREYEDDVPEEEKESRLRELIHLQESVSLDVNQSLVGEDVDVLVEGLSRKDEYKNYGRTDNFKTVVFPGNDEKPGDMVIVKVKSATSHTLFGSRK
jgi:tRNA-2-methylthio-N6-dimethylallyladenosine synthase